MTAEQRFYFVEEDGPVALALEPSVGKLDLAYDLLELGVYSRLRSYPGGRFLGLQEHIQRTDLSQRLVGIPHRLDHDELRRSIQKATGDYETEATFVRFDLLSHPARAFGTESTTLICITPFTPVPTEYLAEGVGVLFSDLVRDTPLAKSAAFVQERGGYSSGGQDAYERLLISPEQTILECSSSNFFGLIEGRLRCTGEGVLLGVTQRFCILLAQELGLTIDERGVNLAELEQLEEAFLTSSSRGVVPIVRIQGRTIANGRPGPWTERLRRAYDELAEHEAKLAWPI
jgi:branched-subunit amino acid aminotransferase/4-amino-4-deoxychorismate lyase